MMRPSSGSSAMARTGARQSPSTTPASMALAMAEGMAATQRPSGFQNPASTISAPLTRKAPTAAGNPPSILAEVASSAAPGVDQATLIGIRVRRLSNSPHSPIAIDSAIRPEAASACDAPTALRPCTITATELAMPTKAESRPEKTACDEKLARIGTLSGPERLRQILDQVLRILEPDRQPQHPVGDAEALPLLRREPLMRGGGGMGDEALRIAEIVRDVDELEAVQRAEGAFLSARQLERDQGRAAPH